MNRAQVRWHGSVCMTVAHWAGTQTGNRIGIGDVPVHLVLSLNSMRSCRSKKNFQTLYTTIAVKILTHLKMSELFCDLNPEIYSLIQLCFTTLFGRKQYDEQRQLRNSHAYGHNQLV